MTGGICTTILTVIVLVYSTIKLVQMVDKHNPNVSEIYELDFYNFEEVVELKNIGYRIAFSIENYLDR